MKKQAFSVRCNLCGHPRYYLVHREKKTAVPAAGAYTIYEDHLQRPDKIVRCMSCGFVYAIPKEPVDSIIRDYVDMADPEYISEEKGRRRQAQAILRFIAQSKMPPGRMLDIGCGPGFLLAEAAAQGWRAQGVDLSTWASDTARERFGIEVFRGELHDARFPDKNFDVIVMNDVIEHLEDPKACLVE